MSGVPPVQAFQIGQRVRCGTEGRPWLIGSIYVSAFNGRVLFAEDLGGWGIDAVALTLAPARPPYVPSERRIVSREGNCDGTPNYINERFRPENNLQMAARHVVERAEHDAQGDGRGMTMTIPAQAFQIGQRVRRIAGEYFTIGAIYIGDDLTIRYARASGILGSTAKNLTLTPERPPYVASERQTVSCLVTVYRCETNTELAARHAVERAEYDRLGADDPVIYNASGGPIGITGRTGQPGPGAP